MACCICHIDPSEGECFCDCVERKKKIDDELKVINGKTEKPTTKPGLAGLSVTGAFLTALVVAYIIAPAQKDSAADFGQECLFTGTLYLPDGCNPDYLVFKTVKSDSYKWNYAHVRLDNIDVRLRTDGANHTSLLLLLCNYEGALEYSFATILVPLAEDVEPWKQKLEETKKERENFIQWYQNYKKPKRVLPH